MKILAFSHFWRVSPVKKSDVVPLCHVHTMQFYAVLQYCSTVSCSIPHQHHVWIPSDTHPTHPNPSRPLIAPLCYILLRRVICYTTWFLGDLSKISTGYYAGVWALMCLFCLRKCFLDFWVVRRISVKSFCLNWIAVQMLFWVVIEKQSWGKLKPDRINSEMEKDQFYAIFY